MTEILWREIDVDNALLELGLDRMGLLRAVRFAEHERSFCTTNDPVGYQYMVVYAKAARGLREEYLSQGWLKDETNNQAAIKNPTTIIRVVPCNFNEFAGNRLVTPSNKAPKGEISRQKSTCNRTAWLPGVPDIDPALNDGYRTYILGIYTDDEQSTGAELSLPVAFKGNYFTSFGRRIILRSDDDERTIGKRITRGGDATEIVDISIRRR